MKISLAALFLYLTPLTLMFSTAHAEVFKWTDEAGRIHYSDKKPDNLQAKEVKIKPHNQPVIIDASNATESTADSKVPNEDATDNKKPYKKKQKVTMYSASWCGYCKKARAYFRNNKIRYTEYDIEKSISNRNRYKKLGGTGLPLLVVKRNQMQGFNATKFENWYDNL